MRRTLVALAFVLAVPAFAAIGPDITLPVAGEVVLPGHTYKTELTLTNHRDAVQSVVVEFVSGGHSSELRMFQMNPHATLFVENSAGWVLPGVGAIRFTAVTDKFGQDDDDPFLDPRNYLDAAGLLEAKAFIINERGPFGLYGSSRQEVESIAAREYTASENVFVGVLHQPPTYTNVGIVNLDPTQTVTFYVQYQYLEPVPVTVGPLSSQQIRVTGGRSPSEEGNAGRYVIVTPEWAKDGSGTPTPWVAYASTVDGITGDAFSGVRVPLDTTIRR